MLIKIKNYIFSHKKISLLFLVIILVAGYFTYGKIFGTSSITKYALAKVEKGTIIVSVEGSGQVAATNQIDVKPKVSGDVIYVAVKSGQTVKAGQALVYLNDSNAQKSVRDAQINLNSANISLEKLTRDQQSSLSDYSDNLEQAYSSALNKISVAFLSLPDMIETAREVLYDDSIKPAGCTPNLCEYGNLVSEDFKREFKMISQKTEDDYTSAKKAYDPNFDSYKNLRIDATKEQITSMLSQTKSSAELLSQAIKSEQNLLNVLVDNINNSANRLNLTAKIPSQVTTYQSNISSAINKVFTIISDLDNAKKSIDSVSRSIDNSRLTDPVDLASQQNIVLQKQAALDDAKENLANYVVRALFAGKITNIDLQKGDSVSTGTVVTSLLTNQSYADVSLNEVDVAKVKIGQKATITFDAIPDLTLTGIVSDIDAVGTVSQGVVTYNVKITFDSQNDSIKPGMSVSAAIITDIKSDILMIPNSSVKVSSGTNYVLVPSDETIAQNLFTSATSSGVIINPSPVIKNIEIGLANESMTEVINGLNEGDIIITRTISSSSSSSKSPASGGNILQGGGGVIRATTGGFQNR
jgi:HlyD family secretion protein